EPEQQPGLFSPGVRAWPQPSNMFPAWRRGRRTGSSTVAPRTMDTAGRTGQVGQVWVSCWILLSATCILSARAQVDGIPPYFKMEPPQTQVHLEGTAWFSAWQRQLALG
ncbi:protein sidekick-2-like protein, partial [Lates japonicus]